MTGSEQSNDSKEERVALPCPHGRMPSGGEDGWKHCPHCLGLNSPKPSTPTSTDTNTSFKKELREKLDHLVQGVQEIPKKPITDIKDSSQVKESMENYYRERTKWIDHALTSIINLVDKEVIKADEQPIDIRHTDKNTAIFLNNKIAFCNALRAEQRAIIRGSDE